MAKDELVIEVGGSATTPPAEIPRIVGPTRRSKEGQALILWSPRQVVRIEPWGPNAVRVRSTPGTAIRDDLPGALLGQRDTGDVEIDIEEGIAELRHGNITVEVDEQDRIRFLETTTRVELLAETSQWLMNTPARHFSRVSDDLHRLEAQFRAYPNERLYGLGQHQHGLLNQKGAVIELQQRNGEVSIPFLVSNRGYGLLWNNPGIGRVELGHNRTRWIAEGTRQLDYWIVAGDVQTVLHRYADATGHPSRFPDWASGFWQSRVRYRTQQELVDIVAEHRRRDLPLSVVLADFLHSPAHGDWHFNDDWPDPGGLVRYLAEQGVELMVSFWPTINARSKNFQELQERGLLLHSERGLPIGSTFVDNGQAGPAYLYFYDPSNPDAREFVWDRVQDGYHRHGIKNFWLDACEPEILPVQPENWRYHAGSAIEVGNLYPRWNQQTFYDGLQSQGVKEALSLNRSGWAGSQRFGAAVWSGDVQSTFESLRAQVGAVLNIGLSGIPWWSSDIGGYYGSNTTDTPYFRELVVRWFQFSVFTPIFRLHGHRLPDHPDYLLVGAPNEIWHFGDEAFAIIRELLFLRERLRPYIALQARIAEQTGLPLTRPVFVDFPEDQTAWTLEDQFLFGPDVLVAPVLDEGARRRDVYLPAGAEWVDPWTEQQMAGGQWLTVDVPLNRIPVYVRAGAAVPIAGGSK